VWLWGGAGVIALAMLGILFMLINGLGRGADVPPTHEVTEEESSSQMTLTNQGSGIEDPTPTIELTPTVSSSPTPAIQPITVDNIGEISLLHTNSDNTVKGVQVAWSPDSNQVAAVFSDGNILVVDAQSGAKLQQFQISGVGTAISWPSKGSLLAIGMSDGNFQGATGKLIIRDTGEGGSETTEITGSSRPVLSVAWSPDAKYLAFSQGTEVRLWSPETGQITTTLSANSNTSILALAWSPDSESLAAISRDTTVVWNITTGSPTAEVHWSAVMQALAWSQDGAMLASSSAADLILWEPSGEQIRGMSGHSYQITGISFSPDGTIVASSGSTIYIDDDFLILWNTGTGEELRRLPAERNMSHVAWSPDGTMIASLADDGVLMIWGLP
jgi:WD40 repeat protein